MIDGDSMARASRRIAPLAQGVISPGKTRFLRALSWSLAAHATSRLTMLIAGMEVSRRIGVEAFAEFTFFVFSFNLLGAFADFGGSVAILKYSIVSQASGRREEGLERLAASQQLSLFLALLGFGALVIFTRIGTWPWWQVAALGSAGLGICWQVSFASVLLALREMRQLFLGSLLFAAIVGAGVVAASATRDWTALMWALPLAYLAQCALQAFVVQRHLRLTWRTWLRPKAAQLRGVLGLMGFLAPTSAIASLLPWVTANAQLMYHSDAVAIAVFGVSTTLFGLVMTVPSRIGQLVFVDQMESSVAGASVIQAVRSDLRALAATVIAAAAGVVAVTIAGDFILGRYGPEVAAQQLPIFVFIVLAVLAGAMQLLGSRIVASGWPSLWLAVTVVQALVLGGTLLARPVGDIWLPSAAYWAAYLAAVAAAICCYAYALQRPRE